MGSKVYSNGWPATGRLEQKQVEKEKPVGGVWLGLDVVASSLSEIQAC